MNLHHAFLLPACAYSLSLSVLALSLGSGSAVRAPVSKVLLETEQGAIALEVNETAAPVTARNFLRYIEEPCFEEAMCPQQPADGQQLTPSMKITRITVSVPCAGRPDSTLLTAPS